MQNVLFAGSRVFVMDDNKYHVVISQVQSTWIEQPGPEGKI